MGFYERQILPRVTNLVLGGSSMGKLRARAAADLDGEVLEVGFGSGLNVPHYPAAVTKVLAVDPATVGRDLAARRVSESTVPVDYIGLDGQRLPLEDASVDNVFTTFTLCTIPDVHLALTEMRRVLKPGGGFHFLEHGLAEDPKIARLQKKLTPIQKRIAGGCHLDRRIDDLVVDAGFEAPDLARFTMKGPKVMGSMYAGTAYAAG